MFRWSFSRLFRFLYSLFSLRLCLILLRFYGHFPLTHLRCSEGEDERYGKFSKLHNKQLLWHGSRLTNWVGILSQGLRIAPPEAPVTGYMFGKGVYFADMVSKV